MWSKLHAAFSYQRSGPWGIAGRSLLLLGAIACLYWGLSMLVSGNTGRRQVTLRFSAGPQGTRRFAVAEYLAEQSRAHRLSLQLVTNNGSEESLHQLRAGTLDAAVISNGVVVADDDQVMVLGAVQTELVHMLVRPELARSGQPLSKLVRGRRVNLGVQGSTEAILSREFLRFARLKLPTDSTAGDVIPLEMSKDELVRRAEEIVKLEGAERATKVAELPDCLLVLASMPSIVAQKLMDAGGYQLMPLPGARAFLSDNLLTDLSTGSVLDREFLQQGVIPAGSYFTGQSHPEQDLETVAVRLVVVARHDAPPAAVRALMAALFEGEFPRRVKVASPRDVSTPYALHPVAASFLERHQPVAIHDLVDSVANALSIFGAFSAGALTLWGFLRTAPTRRPSDYFASLRQVDSIARGLVADHEAPIGPDELKTYLEERLSRLRFELMQDICEGRIRGDQVITNILVLMKDVRANLLRQWPDLPSLAIAGSPEQPLHDTAGTLSPTAAAAHSPTSLPFPDSAPTPHTRPRRIAA